MVDRSKRKEMKMLYVVTMLFQSKDSWMKFVVMNIHIL